MVRSEQTRRWYSALTGPARFHVSLMKGGGEMKTSVVLLAVLSAAWVILLVQNPSMSAQDGTSSQPTKTIIGDLLDVDRDLYIVRSERGEIHVEATHTTEVTEEFTYGDRIKAVVLMNNKALKIERAGPDDVPGVMDNQPVAAKTPDARRENNGQTAEPSVQPKQPESKTIVGDLLEIDRDLYIVRGERGEIHVEATHTTEVTEEFTYGDRIKAVVLMNNKALKIERAGPDDVPGVTVHDVAASPNPDQGQDQASSSGGESTTQDVAPSTAGQGDEPRVVEGQVLMVDGDFYVLRGELGEIRVERTAETKMTEDVQFGDFIKATVTPNDQALTIERLVP